jgi:hypothetical protein
VSVASPVIRRSASGVIPEQAGIQLFWFPLALPALIPARTLKKLGIKPHSRREFVLANGDVIRRRLATATFEYEGRRGDSMVIVGEPGDDPLLGATTLEGFGLVLDPFRRELRPMKRPLK